MSIIAIGPGFASLAIDAICASCGHCAHTGWWVGKTCPHCEEGTMRVRTEADRR